MSFGEYDPDHPVHTPLATPLAYSPFHDEVSPFADSPTHSNLGSCSRPGTPTREKTSFLLGSGSPRPKSGIVFGTPRRSGRPTNPFSDLQPTGQSAFLESLPESGLKPLELPARSLAYPRRVPDETEASAYRHIPSKSAKHDDESLEQTASNLMEYEENDEEQSMLSEEDNVNEKRVQSIQKRSFWRRRAGPRWGAAASSTNRTFKYLVGTLVISVLCLLIAGVLLALNFHRPAVHWKGTLSDSSGSINTSGFNFTRHIELGFTNRNLFPVTLSGVEAWAAFDNTHYFGHSVNTHVDISVPGRDRRNATLPMEMDFSYISNFDPSWRVLGSMFEACRETHAVPFELIIRAKVKALGMITYTMNYERLAASMDCDNNLAVLLQTMSATAATS